MSCFWDNILISLTEDDFKFIDYDKMNNYNFVRFLKNMNEKVLEVTWDKENLTEQQINENFKHIEDYSVNNIEEGYLCSICDPFLILISYIFRVDIEHIYLDTKHVYNVNNSRKMIKFKSDLTHFSTR